MATPAPSQRPSTGHGWRIQQPAPGCMYALNPGNTITVKVDDNHAGNSGYSAGIYHDGAAPTAFAACTALNPPPVGSSIFAGEVPANPPPFDQNWNVIVYNQDDITIPNTNSNWGIQSGSGSGCGSGSGFELVTSVVPGAAIPTTLHAHVSNAGARDGVYALVYDPQTTAWNSDAVGELIGFRLVFHALNYWQLIVKGPTTYQPSAAENGPSPPFQIVFINVDLDAPGYGGTANAAVEILLSPG